VGIPAGELCLVGAADPVQQPAGIVGAGVGAHQVEYEELVARDKASLDIFWLRDESLEDTDNLPAPEVIAAEIVEDLQAALDQFVAVASSLRDNDTSV
jgi:hypothetical protein